MYHSFAPRCYRYASETARGAAADYIAKSAKVSEAAATAAAAAGSFKDSTDAELPPTTCLQLGAEFLYGQGAGGRPSWGASAAVAHEEEIRGKLEGTDMVFVTAGMGGGTGSGAAPVVARIAKEVGCLTVAVVSSPFGFEGERRMDTANSAIEELSKHVDVLVVVQVRASKPHIIRGHTQLLLLCC